MLFGGKGVEHSVSVTSGKFVLSLLDSEIYDIIPIFIDRSGEWLWEKGKRRVRVTPCRKNTAGGIAKRGRFIRLDAVFPVLHGDFGEDGRIQGLLETLGLPFVGCDTSAGALCADKDFTKAVVHSMGVPTLPWCSLSTHFGEDFCKTCLDTLGLPLFIKPSRLGSSIGAGTAATPEELSLRVGIASEIGGGRVLAEKYLKNPKELECAFLELGGKKYISKPGEIKLAQGFYSFDEKYSESSSAQVSESADIDEESAKKLCAYAERICAALGVKGLARVDFFLSDGELYFNEINTMPGMTETSLYPKLAQSLGIAPRALINGLVADILPREL